MVTIKTFMGDRSLQQHDFSVRDRTHSDAEKLRRVFATSFVLGLIYSAQIFSM